MRVVFYAKESEDVGEQTQSLADGYTYALWRPRLTSITPPGTPRMPFAIWWAMHQMHLLANRNYSLFIIFSENGVVHRSCVFPGYFRFPFMDKKDLQIGDTWTAENHRGKGLATFALKKICELTKMPGRRFWYVTEDENISSIRVAENAGFAQVGTGRRVDRLGIRLIGSYKLET